MLPWRPLRVALDAAAGPTRAGTPPRSAPGPSPSCRSRRIRRRSSSRATTSRSRLSWSSSASRLVRAAVAACRTRSPSSCSSRRLSRLRSPRAGSTSRPTARVAVGDRQGAGLRRALAVGGHQPLPAGAVDLDAHEADPERLRHRAGHRGELPGPRRRSPGSTPARPRCRTGCPGRRAPVAAPRRRTRSAAVRRAARSPAARRAPPRAPRATRRAAWRARRARRGRRPR